MCFDSFVRKLGNNNSLICVTDKKWYDLESNEISIGTATSIGMASRTHCPRRNHRSFISTLCRSQITRSRGLIYEAQVNDLTLTQYFRELRERPYCRTLASIKTVSECKNKESRERKSNPETKVSFEWKIKLKTSYSTLCNQWHWKSIFNYWYLYIIVMSRCWKLNVFELLKIGMNMYNLLSLISKLIIYEINVKLFKCQLMTNFGVC